MSRIIAYTAIFGHIGDQLQPLKYPAYRTKTDSLEYYAFVDGLRPGERKIDHSTGWTLCAPVWAHETNPRLRARRHKLLSHQLFPEADFTIWVDGCLTPARDPVEIVDYYMLHNDLCTFMHMQRNCVYAEGQACLRLRKDHPDIINTVLTRYKLEGYPEEHGLAETTAVIRRHTDVIVKFNEMWWTELRSGSVRDQLSFDYVAWKLRLPYMTFEGTRTENPNFDWTAHR